jgi:hypothetical protein
LAGLDFPLEPRGKPILVRTMAVQGSVHARSWVGLRLCAGEFHAIVVPDGEPPMLAFSSISLKPAIAILATLGLAALAVLGNVLEMPLAGCEQN